MSTNHFTDQEGNYIGGFGDGAEPPEGSIACDAPPDGRMKKVNGKWIPNQEKIDADAAAQALIDDYNSLEDGPIKRLFAHLFGNE